MSIAPNRFKPHSAGAYCSAVSKPLACVANHAREARRIAKLSSDMFSSHISDSTMRHVAYDLSAAMDRLRSSMESMETALAAASAKYLAPQRDILAEINEE